MASVIIPRMKNLFWLLFVIGCSSVKVSPPSEVVTPPPVVISNGNLNSITELARDSSCAKYSWKDRGKAPLGYVKGMAFAFAKSYCKKRASGREVQETSKDALYYYGIKPGNMVNTYALLIGLGMRESSGQYCEGRDMSASNTSSDTAEAGPFQTSWNASTSDAALPQLAKEYQTEGVKCFLDVWQEGVSKSHCNAQGSYYGSDNGYLFQKSARNCPAFAAEFAAITIRSLRPHYGPLNTKAAEFRGECVDLFSKVKAIVDSAPGLCEAL